MKTLALSDDFYLSPVEWNDREALVEHLQARAISRNTFYIPYPYSTEDAETWIEQRIAHRQDQPAPVTFALRAPDGTLVGVVGADDLEVGTSHRANIGYWLAKPYWGRGLMTEAVRRYTEYAFERLEVVRLTAEVFTWNDASRRVLEKVGFRQEGYFRKHRKKEGRLVDALYYGLLREDVAESDSRSGSDRDQ
jgi:RimJ/RimL family protein N-acetyltransferase